MNAYTSECQAYQKSSYSELISKKGKVQICRTI